ncbi:patatin-like phospholipase family protein [Biformimicrobium ophioploci]|nr:patatin-like phospholipase family protein [Microbulbifer sp. NKW57]
METIKKPLGLLLGCLLLAGCAATRAPQNPPIPYLDESSGYRPSLFSQSYGDHQVILAFSGGGTRASALSYGVMKELRDTSIPDGPAGYPAAESDAPASAQSTSLLSEVDLISSVSGGSFTAAYYGLYGERIFEDYEKDFLKSGVQSTLIRRLFNPMYWGRLLFGGYDRTELAIEYYDQLLFKGATYADLSKGDLPFVAITATDLYSGLGIVFSQDYFDFFCSDLDEFSVARAVTASSAVPVAFPTVVLNNFNGNCGVPKSFLRATGNVATSEYQVTPQDRPLVFGLVNRREAYAALVRRPYIHLVDGGVADNLGLRALLEHMALTDEQTFIRQIANAPEKNLVILVNAEVSTDSEIGLSAAKPGAIQAASTLTNMGLEETSRKTKELFREKAREFERITAELGYPKQVYFVEISFASIPSKEAKLFFNKLPTSLELKHDEVDRLIAAGRKLLRNNPEFQRFLRDAGGTGPR